MHIGIRRNIFSVIFFFLAANVLFAQIPVRRTLNLPPVSTASGKQVSEKSKIRPLRRKIPTVIFGASHPNESFSYHTVISGSKTKISFDIDLGRASFTKSNVTIKNADQKHFGNVTWSNIAFDKLPPGVSYSTAGKVGEPEIPMLSIIISIPDAATNITSFLQQNSNESLPNSFLVPKADTNGVRSYSPTFYQSSNRPEPVLSSPAKIRTMRIISLIVPLVEFNSANGLIRAKKKFTCGITFDQTTQLASSSKNNSDPVFSAIYSKIAANTSDIERFRGSFHNHPANAKLQPTSGTPTFDPAIINWIDPGAQYIKLYATRTGLYRVTAAEAGITSWRQSEVRMFNKGLEVPIWIDSTSDGRINAIEYYGERLAGYPGEYYNWDTDSNAYWLTNSPKFQTPPKRFRDKAVSGNPTLTISEGDITLYHERDYFYYGGDKGRDDATLQRFEWIAGERFVWREMADSTTTIIDTFNITSLPSDLSGKNATIKFFLRGMSTNNSPVTHHETITINGNEYPDIPFNDFDELRSSITVPFSQLKTGINTFKIAFRQGQQSPDQWYFDYYEVSLHAPLAQSTDTAIASGQWAFNLVPAQSQFNISLQSIGETPQLFNLSDGSKLISNGSIYKDEASDTTKYVAAITSSFLHPDRIKDVTGTFASILDSSAGADYIVITHPMFLQSALILAKRRQDFSGLRTKVVTTDEVFNAFDFGSDEPWAIRRYLQYAYDYYHGAPPSFVTLFGEGTWDPKFILNNPLEDISSRTIHRSLVPTFGTPSSDYVYTTVEGTGFTDSSTFRMIISRIPAENQDDAQNFLNKLVEYETSAPAPWNKNFLFISGGDAGLQAADLLDDEHAFVGDSTSFAPRQNTFGGLGNPPISIQPTFISRHDMVANVDVTQIPLIQSAFKAGQTLVYFFGHGAPNITDVQFPDVGSLHNQGVYPVLITVSCRTGAFAEPNIISMNESFIKQPEGGAILAYGTTGFGEVEYDFNMSAQIFNFMRADSSFSRMPSVGPHKINMPMIMTASKFIWSIIQSDPQAEQADFNAHNSLYEYTILGDAATGFALRPQPEFAVTPSDITLSGRDSVARTVFSLSDSEITIKATLHNYGYGITNPVHVRISDIQPGNRQVVLIDTITTFELLATSGAVISLDSFAVGSNTLDVFIDYDNQFAETDENDNEASVTFLVNPNSGALFYPPEGSKFFCDIRTDSVNVIMLLPANPKGGSTPIEMQFDTTSAFNSNALIDFSGLNGSGVFFQHAFARSALPNPVSKVLWLRSRITLPTGNQSSWQVRSFSLDAPKPAGARSEFSYSTGDQLATTIISGLQIDKSDGALVIPQHDTVTYEIDARGYLDQNVVNERPIGQLLINGSSSFQSSYLQNGNFLPLAVLELTPDSSSLDSIFEFASDATLADFVSTINGIPDGRRIFVLTNFNPNVLFWLGSDSAKAAMRLLGSKNGMDSIGFATSYALIGRKGMQSGQAIERFAPANSFGVTLNDQTVTIGKSGVAKTPFTAIANSYGLLRWKPQSVNSHSRVIIRVFGERKIGGAIDTLLVTDASTGTSADLSSNPASFYDRVFMKMNFERDSTTAISPRLNQIELEYDPAPEFATSDSLISITPNIVLEGNPVSVTYQIQNVTCIDGQKVPVQLIQSYHGKSTIVATDTIANFPGHSTVSFTHSLATTSFQGNVQLTATVNPGNILNEQLSFNNSANAIYTDVHDSTKPKLDLLFDGIHINSGDFVSSKVVTEIRLSDNSPLRVMDSTSISGVLQALFGSASPVVFSGNKITSGFSTRFITQPSGTVQAILDITPDSALVPGRYLFTAMGNDASGNRADTISDEFVVSGTNGLDHVMNYPNPFKSNTWFTFILKSSSQANVKVIVYTIAGRKIRTLYLDPAKQHAGLNSIEWDGRDEMGNDVANGTYLYRVVLNGTNDDGTASSDATTERAVRSR